MLGVTKVSIKGDYTVFIEFNDGQNGIINLKEKLQNDHREIIRELLDLNKFNTVKLGYHTLCWDNGVDFAPEFLYEQLELQNQGNKKVA